MASGWVKANIIPLVVGILSLTLSFASGYGYISSKFTGYDNKFETMTPTLQAVEELRFDVNDLQKDVRFDRGEVSDIEVLIAKNIEALDKLDDTLTEINKTQIVQNGKIEGLDLRVKKIEEKVGL